MPIKQFKHKNQLPISCCNQHIYKITGTREKNTGSIMHTKQFSNCNKHVYSPIRQKTDKLCENIIFNI